MKRLIKNLGYVQIFEEDTGQNFKITATNGVITKLLVTFRDENSPGRIDFFREVAYSYFQEIKHEFEYN